MVAILRRPEVAEAVIEMLLLLFLLTRHLDIGGVAILVCLLLLIDINVDELMLSPVLHVDRLHQFRMLTDNLPEPR